MFRLLLLALAAAAAALSTPRTARAGYDWCSIEPTHQFRLPGHDAPVVVHVFVAVPLSVLPITQYATLIVLTHASVPGVERSSSPDARLPITTTFVSDARTDVDVIDYFLLLPKTAGEFPVRLTVTQAGKPSAEATGMSGQTLHLSLPID